MDRLGDDPVIVHFFFGGEFGGVLRYTTGFIGGDAAGDHQAHPAGRPFGIKRRQSLKTVGRFLETGMHRSHDDPIFKADKPKVKRSQHTRVRHRIHVRRSKWFSARCRRAAASAAHQQFQKSEGMSILLWRLPGPNFGCNIYLSCYRKPV
jgi:hypothetical protein